MKKPFEEMRKERKIFPKHHETKEQRVQRKHLESVPLERKESRKKGLFHLNKSADRMGYEHPVDKQASKILK